MRRNNTAEVNEQPEAHVIGGAVRLQEHELCHGSASLTTGVQGNPMDWSAFRTHFPTTRRLAFMDLRSDVRR